MRTGWLLLALCACDAVFGLRETRRIPQDARATCPAIGTPPTFGPTYYQVFDQECADFSPSPTAGYALASCQGPTMRVLFGGPFEGPLAPITITGAMPCTLFESARLYPEGDRAHILTNGSACTAAAGYEELIKVDDTTWQLGAPLPFGQTGNITVGTPSAGPHRHVLEGTTNPTLLHELVDQEDGTWREVAQYTPGDLAPDIIGASGSVELTPDGLRLVFRGQFDAFSGAIYYADRPSIDARFAPATRLDNVPDVLDAYLTASCNKLYFSGAQRVFYMEQQ